MSDLGSIFTDPAAYADPERWHASAKKLRETSPIHRVQIDGFPPFWAITKHADVLEIERNPEIFTNSPVTTLVPADKVAGMADAPVKALVQMDGEEHKAHRAIVNDWFKPAGVKNLQGSIDELAKHFVDEMAARDGRCDFLTDIALHYPLRVILSVLGLPVEDYPRMLQLTQQLFSSEDPDFARLGEDEAQLNVLLDLVTYFTNLAEERRAHPTSDLASVIANAELHGAPLPDLDMLGHFVIIATAGHDTTSSAIAGGLVALLGNPAELDLLYAQPELIDGAAADELIRFVSPVKQFTRTCRVPFTLRDVTFTPGDLVLLSYASANRDEDVFDDPFHLDIRRENALRHLAFGFGPHFCLGAHLARLEIRTLFKELLARVDNIALTAEPTWTKSYFVEGPKSVPISYSMR
jgi:cytochrome P450